MPIVSVRNVKFSRWLVAVLAITLALTGLTSAQTSGDKAADAQGDPQKAVESPTLFPAGLPTMQMFLKSALDQHPDVVVARSKVEAARADLLKAEAIALRELMELHQRVASMRQNVDLLRQAAAKKNEQAIVQLRSDAAQLNLLEWDLAMSMGMHTVGRTAPPQAPLVGGNQAATNDGGADDIYVDVAYPKGNLANKIKSGLQGEIDQDFEMVSVAELCDFISGKTGIQIVVDEERLKENEIDPDEQRLKLKGKGMAMASLLQQIEDRYEPLSFVIRDYGILLTCVDDAPIDAVTVRDFVNLSETDIRAKVKAARKAQSGMGGFGGGGFGGGGGFF